MTYSVKWLSLEDNYNEKFLKVFEILSQSLKKIKNKKNIKFIPVPKDNFLEYVKVNCSLQGENSVYEVANKLLSMSVVVETKNEKNKCIGYKYINVFSEIDWYKDHSYCFFYLSETFGRKDFDNFISSFSKQASL